MSHRSLCQPPFICDTYAVTLPHLMAHFNASWVENGGLINNKVSSMRKSPSQKYAPRLDDTDDGREQERRERIAGGHGVVGDHGQAANDGQR